MSLVYGVKPEDKYLGTFFARDSAPVLKIEYKKGVEFPLVSIEDFNEWFGCKDIDNIENIGILCDYEEYKNSDEEGCKEKLISVKPSQNVKSKILQLDSKYANILGKGKTIFKCVPLSRDIRSHIFIDVYVTSPSSVELVNEVLTTQLKNFIRGLTLTPIYNNIIYEVPIDNYVVTCKIYGIIFSGIVADETRIHYKSSSNVTIQREFLYNMKNKYMTVSKASGVETSQVIDITNTNNKYMTVSKASGVETSQVIDITNTNNIIVKIGPLPLSFDFSKLKVGGLRQQLQEISNVIRPRGINKDYLEKIGMDEFEKGIILYGPPGTGKTTIARELSNILGVKQFVVVNGPEILTKYVGESEANVRRVLENSSDNLKVVFFDEFDCIAKERTGGDGQGSQVASNVVNQILAIMDGVDKKNNILIIAATNRINLIDSALLRPGRFGLCLYIGLPDRDGRKDIFEIHLLKNIQNNTLSKDVTLDWLADNSENYSGAEIKGICKKAREIALATAAPDLTDLTNIDINLLILYKHHFELAFSLIKSGFSGNGCNAPKILPDGDGNLEAIQSISKFCIETDLSPRIHTYLLTGPGWSKKSSSCRVICERYKHLFDMILIITNNLINELTQLDLTTGKSILIILDSLENLCGILNSSSYNPKNIENLNQFVGKVVVGKVILIATMRSSAYSIFSIINPVLNGMSPWKFNNYFKLKYVT